ncbi:MAG: D-glycerate dehydrogenase [bacterium]|nr:D-glycerate dehydrogenase [bacterium]
MPKVYVTRRVPEPAASMLAAKNFTVATNPDDRVLSRQELLKAAVGADALLALLTDKIDGEVMDAAGPQLKIVANYAVGYDNIDLAAAKDRGIIVTNTPGVLTEAVAEHAFALLMAIARRVPESDAFMRAGGYVGWAPMLLLGTEVHDKVLGIVGLGRIGSSLAQKAVKGFGMRVVYYDVKPSEEFERAFGARYCGLSELLKESDFVSIHVPLIPATKHLIDEKALKGMKKGAYLINTSRGPVIDEVALVKALGEGWIAGAALDVFENEPKLAPGLANCANVVLTPHTASATLETRSAMARIAAENIIAVLEGKEPPNPVKAS